MDLSKLSDSDLLALHKGDLRGLSDEALTMLGSASTPPRQNSNFDVAMGGINRGIAAVPDSVLNTPTNIMNLGKAAFGTGAIALGRPDLAPDMTPTPDYVRKGLEKISSINSNQEPGTPGQKLLQTVAGGVGAGIATPAASFPEMLSNALMGGVSGGAGDVTEHATGNKALGIAASLAAPSAIPKIPAAIGTAGKNVLGVTTGVGPENIAMAAKAGYEGRPAFFENLSGEVPKTEVLDQARQALGTIRNNRSREYQNGIATTAADATPLNFGPIDSALTKVADTMNYGGHSKIGENEAGKISEIQDVVAEWRNDPSVHTAMGLDALKQRIDAIDVPPGLNQAQRAKTAIRNAVKEAVVNQSPEYADTMRAYEESKNLEDEITRTLSLGNNAASDTALRKLQSLSRNNANANYGYRLDLAKALEEQGGKDLMPAIAGQAMNTWSARGLGGQGENIATLLYGWHNPAAFAALPFQSPKAVGATLYGAGKAARVAGKYLPDINVTPELKNLAAMLMYQNSLPARTGEQ